MSKRKRMREKGAVALEYVLVTTFTAVLTIAALVFIGAAVKEKLATLGEKLGTTAEVGEVDWFGE